MSTRTSAKKGMTQAAVVKLVAEKFQMKPAEAKKIFDDLRELATSEIQATGEFLLPNFGKLVVSTRKARVGRNPATGETIDIPSKTRLRFRLKSSAKLAMLAGDSTTEIPIGGEPEGNSTTEIPIGGETD